MKYLELGMNPEWLRYYIAAKLNAGVEDLDFNPDDFVARVNSDLVGKLVNIASRSAGFISRHFAGQLARQLPEPRCTRSLRTRAAASPTCTKSRDFCGRDARDHGARRQSQPLRR